MNNDTQLDKIAKFEDRMLALERDNPDLAKACRSVHGALSLARVVAEAVFNDGVADSPEIVMAIHAAIADDLDDIRSQDEEEDDPEASGEEWEGQR